MLPLSVCPGHRLQGPLVTPNTARDETAPERDAWPQKAVDVSHIRLRYFCKRNVGAWSKPLIG